MATWRAVATAGRRSRASSDSRSHAELLRGRVEDLGQAAGIGGGVVAEAAQHMANEAGRGLLALERGVGDHADQRALERAHAAVHAVRDLAQHLGRHLDLVDAGALGEDRPAQGRRRRLELDHQAGAEALGQAVLEIGQVVGAAVGGHHQLAPGVEQGVEGVEELLARLGPAGEELDVVDQDDVGAAEVVLEVLGAVAAHRVDEAGGELLDRGVADAQPRAVALDVVADRVQQVGLAEPGRAVQEERVVRLGRQLGDGQRGGVGEAVALADHELVEAVLRVEPAAGGGVGRPGLGASGAAPSAGAAQAGPTTSTTAWPSKRRVAARRSSGR